MKTGAGEKDTLRLRARPQWILKRFDE